MTEVQVYWFDDTGRGGSARAGVVARCSTRTAITWKPVRPTGPYGVEINKYNVVSFRAGDDDRAAAGGDDAEGLVGRRERVESQVVLVTGGGRGIGAATARLAAQRGYAVAVNYEHDRESADAVVAEITGAGGRAIAVRADVASEADVFRLFHEIDSRLGRLTALVNNAGIVEPQMRLEMMTAERIARMFAVNVVGTMLCAREAVRRMSTSHGGPGGVIINLSSIAARLGSPGEYVDYAASKGAIDTFTIGLAREVAAEGIRVNAVRPGFTYTEIHARGGEPGRVDRLERHGAAPARRAADRDRPRDSLAAVERSVVRDGRDSGYRGREMTHPLHRHRAVPGVRAAVLASCVAQAPGESRTTFHAFLDEDWKYWMAQYPETATAVGVPGHDARWTDYSARPIDARNEHLRDSVRAAQGDRSHRARAGRPAQLRPLSRHARDRREGLTFENDAMPIRERHPAQPAACRSTSSRASSRTCRARSR